MTDKERHRETFQLETEIHRGRPMPNLKTMLKQNRDFKVRNAFLAWAPVLKSTLSAAFL